MFSFSDKWFVNQMKLVNFRTPDKLHGSFHPTRFHQNGGLIQNKEYSLEYRLFAEFYFHIMHILVQNKLSQGMKKCYYEGPSLKLWTGSWCPTFKFWKGSWGHTFQIWGVLGPMVLVPLLHHVINQLLFPLKYAEGLFNTSFDFKLNVKFKHSGVKSDCMTVLNLEWNSKF